MFQASIAVVEAYVRSGTSRAYEGRSPIAAVQGAIDRLSDRPGPRRTPKSPPQAEFLQAYDVTCVGRSRTIKLVEPFSPKRYRPSRRIAVRRAAVGALVLCLPTLSCRGEPRIDASSEEAYARSYDEVRSTLPFDDRFRLDTAVIVVSVEELVFDDERPMENSLHWSKAAEWRPGAMDRLDGRTADELLRLGDSLRAAPASAWRRMIEAQVADLEARRELARLARQHMEAFVIDRSRIHVDPGGQTKQVLIELTLTNSTPETVWRVYFEGALQSDGRDSPWVEGGFEHRFERGLSPGATSSVRIAANQFGDWRLAAGAPSYAALTVHVTGLEGPNGLPLFEAAAWDEGDETRLETLRRALN